MHPNIKAKIKRERKKYTQAGIAKKLGVSQQFLSQVINKKRPMPYRLQSRYNKIINAI